MCNLSPNLFHSETTVIKAHFVFSSTSLSCKYMCHGWSETYSMYENRGERLQGSCSRLRSDLFWRLQFENCLNCSSLTVHMLLVKLKRYTQNSVQFLALFSSLWACNLSTCQDPNRHLLLTHTSSHDVLPFYSIPSVTVVLLEYKSKQVGI